MALAGRDEIGIDVELVAFDADFAVDDRLQRGWSGRPRVMRGFVGMMSYLSCSVIRR